MIVVLKSESFGSSPVAAVVMHQIDLVDEVSVRALYITSKPGNEPLTPLQIVERVSPLFDNLNVDAEYPKELCRIQFNKYVDFAIREGRSASDFDQWVRKSWDGALAVHGWDNGAESERFRTLLLNRDNFILEFYHKLSWPVRRRIAKRIAEAIDYDFALGEEW